MYTKTQQLLVFNFQKNEFKRIYKIEFKHNAFLFVGKKNLDTVLHATFYINGVFLNSNWW